MKRYYKFLVGLFFPIVILLVWQLMYDFNYLPASQSSSPKLILQTFINLTTESNFLSNLWLSVFRLLIGVLIGSFLGVFLGIISSTQKSFNRIFAPTIQFFSGVPVVVWIPFWIMIFGIGESFKIGLVAISTFFLVYGSTYQSVLSIDKKYLELGILYKKRYIDMIKKVYLPYSLYPILGTVRLSLMIGWIVLFFVEYSISFEGKEGIGWFIANARGVGQVDEEFVGLIVLGTVAFLIDLIIGFYQKNSIKWKK